jgi:hypothetical protein
MALDSTHWLRRLGDPSDLLATSAFALECLDPLSDQLRRRYPRVDPDLALDAAGEAVARFLQNPSQYDPSRRSLMGYLRMAAERDLLNLFRVEKSHWPKNRVFVELADWAGNEIRDEAFCLDDFPALTAVRNSLSERDRSVFELMRQGERKDGVFAALLELVDRPLPEQRAEIKRTKDRILARFRRVARRELS